MGSVLLLPFLGRVPGGSCNNSIHNPTPPPWSGRQLQGSGFQRNWLEVFCWASSVGIPKTISLVGWLPAQATRFMTAFFST